MRKLSVLLITGLLMMLTAFPAAAVPAQDLGALAAYLPEDTVAYVALRSDEAFFDELDGVLQTAIAKLPPGMLPPITVGDLLDQLGANTGGDDWESTFGSWLGDSFALAYVDPEQLLEMDSNGLRGVFEVKDAQAAAQFLKSIEFDLVTEPYQDGALIYPSDAGTYDSYYFLNDEVLIVTSTGFDFDIETQGIDWFINTGASLADNPDFIASLDRLPLDDYNGVGYLSVDAFIPLAAEIQDELEYELSGFPLDLDLPAVFAALGAQSAGITVLDGRSLTLDIAANVTDPVALEAAGITLDGGQAISLDFTARFAPDTVAFLQDTGIGANILQSIAQAKAIGDFYEEEAEVRFLNDEEQALQFVDDAITFVELAWQGMSGQSLEDSLSWMTGDFAVALRATDGDIFPLLPDIGLVIDSPNDDDAMIYVDSVYNIFYELGWRIGDVEDGSFALTSFAEGFNDPDLTIIMDGTDGIFSLGTPTFSGDMRDGGASLTDTDSFGVAQSTFLPDTQFLAYINAAPLVPVAQTLAQFEDDFEMIEVLLPVLDSANVTAVYDETGSGVVRLVLTVAE